MRRTKPASANSMPSGTRNRGTQTENFDSLIEVAKLEEQVRMLQLENNVLRKHTEDFNKLDNVVHRKSIYLTPQATSKINVEKFCGCKGNCSSRICGCVKKNNKCGSSCKCDVRMCQNQKSKSNQENKENVDRSDTETPKKQSRKKNEIVERTKNNKSLFSPDMRQLYRDLEEGQFSDIYFSFNEKNTITENSQKYSDNMNNVESKKKKKEKKEENDKEQQELPEKVIFDPMKPRHQLSRTPPNSKKLEKPLENENIIQPQLHEPAQKVAIISSLKTQDIKEEKVNWEEHTAQLIPCKKCKRTFLPNRIQKHEACCKKV